MEKFKDLSISDLKSAADYIEKLKRERLDDLKSQEINSKDDKAINDYDQLEFEIHRELFSRLMKLRKS